jgi:integrase/recombinase XerD
MALNLYRRHGSHCQGGRSPQAMTYESDEGRRSWKKCSCPIYASGTLAGKFKRKNTERDNWGDAKAMAAQFDAAGNWDGKLNAPPPEPIATSVTARMTIERAVSVFLSEHGEMLAPNTLRKYRFILGKLKSHSEAKGYVLIEQWTPMDVREFRAEWQVSAFTASKNMTVVKSFFEFALVNEWINRNPSRLVKNLRGQAQASERIPFSDDELKRMFQACETQYGKKPIRWSRDVHHHAALGETANYKYKWTGQDLADFISVSVYTGLRISDVCTFQTDRLLENGECHIRTTKTGRKVYTWIPQWLQDRIRARSMERGSAIFGEHATKDINVVTDVWRRKLKRLWALCGPWPETPTPHRFRHTFARILLQRANVSVRDVAELLGDTEEIVRKHYASWVPERQARLTKILQDAFEDKPKPNVVAIR